ncbi:uncharacterized protein LOC136032993 [Artemia franciscana]|uniref:Uncharacterized protein n=1 Tax=Artemia franciscana TaxID=6661 RepID=A0AA88IQQ5_ARTSF|nr:hypothetical protein QYM36_001437 [Artemia franciscana]
MLKHCVSSPHAKSQKMSAADSGRLAAYNLYQQVDGFTKTLPQSEVFSIVVQQQLRSLIRRLLVFESNLREEQKKIMNALETKDRELAEQKIQIDILEKKNRELFECLERKSGSGRKRTQSVPNLKQLDSNVRRLVMKYESSDFRRLDNPYKGSSTDVNEMVKGIETVNDENLQPVADILTKDITNLKICNGENTNSSKRKCDEFKREPFKVNDEKENIDLLATEKQTVAPNKQVFSKKCFRDITNLNALGEKSDTKITNKLDVDKQKIISLSKIPEKPKRKLNTTYDRFLEVTGLVQKSILSPSRVQKRKLKRNHVILKCNVSPALSRLVKEKLGRTINDSEV